MRADERMVEGGSGSPTAADERGGTPAAPGRVRYWITAIALRILVGVVLRTRLEGRENLPEGAAILCFNHQSWADPFVLIAALPARPDLMVFGPKEADMAVGARNRLIAWTQRAVPVNPEGGSQRDVVRTMEAIMRRGAHVAIAPEGRIHVGERVILPIDDGVAFFALRTGAPIVPVGITGVGWLRFGGRVRVRIGAPMRVSGRPTRAAIEAVTLGVRRAMLDLVSDAPDRRPPGRFGRWFTELFNDWPEGERPAAPQSD